MVTHRHFIFQAVVVVVDANGGVAEKKLPSQTLPVSKAASFFMLGLCSRFSPH